MQLIVEFILIKKHALLETVTNLQVMCSRHCKQWVNVDRLLKCVVDERFPQFAELSALCCALLGARFVVPSRVSPASCFSRTGTNRKRKYGTPVSVMHSAGDRCRSQNQLNAPDAYLQQVQQQEEELQ